MRLTLQLLHTRIRRALLGGAVLLLAVPALLGAQDQRLERAERVFVKTKPIEKILGHRFGFRVFYVRGDQSLDSFYVPANWFSEAGGKGQMFFGDAPEYPFMQIYWVDGEFSLIRLFVRRNRDHITWGMLRGGEELRPNFEVDTLQLAF